MSVPTKWFIGKLDFSPSVKFCCASLDYHFNRIADSTAAIGLRHPDTFYSLDRAGRMTIEFPI